MSSLVFQDIPILLTFPPLPEAVWFSDSIPLPLYKNMEKPLSRKSVERTEEGTLRAVNALFSPVPHKLCLHLLYLRYR